MVVFMSDRVSLLTRQHNLILDIFCEPDNRLLCADIAISSGNIFDYKLKDNPSMHVSNASCSDYLITYHVVN